jgi:hypothetical protein
MHDEEIYNQNGLTIIHHREDWDAFVVRTSSYSIVVSERLEEDTWDISVIDRLSQKSLIRVNTSTMPTFMSPFDGFNVKRLTNADEVNYLVNRLLAIKIFL